MYECLFFINLVRSPSNTYYISTLKCCYPDQFKMLGTYKRSY